MPSPIIKVENLSKQYRLGSVGTGTLSHDLKRWYYNVRGKEDPYLKIGEENDRGTKGESEYVWALKDIDFEVMPGEVLGIIGKNGAGKSTLLKILSKVTGPTTGGIHYNGRIGALLEVGTGFHPELTGRENIFLNGAILGMTKQEIRSKLDEIVDFSGVERYLDTPVKRYSSGMMVRLGFAVAAHLEPEILIVDEVLAVGDAEFQKKAIGKMQDVSQQNGKTVLFVSHNMASIKSLCNRSLLLHNGSVKTEGKTDDIISCYLDENTRLRQIDVKDRIDRQGSKAAMLTSLFVVDKHTNKKVDTVLTGQKVQICLEFTNKLAETIMGVDISMGVFNKSEQALFMCSNSLLGKKSELKSGKNQVFIEFEKWPTSAGNYQLNILARNQEGIIDYLQNAGTLNVEPGDFYGNGNTVNDRWQTSLVNYSYSSTN